MKSLIDWSSPPYDDQQISSRFDENERHRGHLGPGRAGEGGSDRL